MPVRIAHTGPRLALLVFAELEGRETVPDSRAYVFGKDGHRFLKMSGFSVSHPNAAAAIEAARILMDGYSGELWTDDRLICRFTNGNEPSQTLREYTIDSVSVVPAIPVVHTTPRIPSISAK